MNPRYKIAAEAAAIVLPLMILATFVVVWAWRYRKWRKLLRSESTIDFHKVRRRILYGDTKHD
jgi:membrane protein YdbS with pleckstrin-like domain